MRRGRAGGVIRPPGDGLGGAGHDHLAEGGVEPGRDGGTAVGDGAGRPGVTAEPDPAMADRQFGAGQGMGLRVGQEVGDELGCGSARFRLGSLHARREGGERACPTPARRPVPVGPRTEPGCDPRGWWRR